MDQEESPSTQRPRHLIAPLGNAIIRWPFVARAQQKAIASRPLISVGSALLALLASSGAIAAEAQRTRHVGLLSAELPTCEEMEDGLGTKLAVLGW